MSKNGGKDDLIYGNNEAEDFITKSRNRGKEEISRKLHKGRAFYEAMQTPQGKILLNKYDRILDEAFLEIINFKPDKKASIEENYYSILTKIVSYNAVQRTGNEWSSVIRELQQGIKEMRTENEKLELK